MCVRAVDGRVRSVGGRRVLHPPVEIPPVGETVIVWTPDLQPGQQSLHVQLLLITGDSAKQCLNSPRCHPHSLSVDLSAFLSFIFGPSFFMFSLFSYTRYANMGTNTLHFAQDLTSGESEWVTGPLKYATEVTIGRFRSVQFIILMWTSVCSTIGAQMHTYSLSELVTGLLSPTHISHKST